MKIFYFLAVSLLIAGHANAQADTADKVFSFVEQMPEFPGGDGEIMQFILKNLETPSTTDDWCSSFRVRFVIDTDGSVINQVMTKSCGSCWDERILRLVKLFPKFKPGYQNGRAVKVYYNLPISCLKPQDH